MWITKLRLNNIKSYGDDVPEIHFVEGVNLIQGHNGAGKSTILEAIGLALFGSSPYKLSQILREGCKSGEIAVTFVSFRDGREYQVVRKLGSGGTANVFDAETARKLCENVSDTADFVRDHLGAQPDADLKALFEDAIGVPQGTMTAIFLENPGTRKSKFDGLLRVNDYENVWNKLRETGNHIEGLLKANNEQQARLAGILDDLPGVNESITALTASLEVERQTLSGIELDLQAVSGAVETGKAVKAQLSELLQKLNEAEFAVKQIAGDVQRAEAVVQEAEKAAVVVAETGEAHEVYESALRLIDELEEKRLTLDQLKAEQARVNTDLSVGKHALESAQQALAAVDAAADELKRLEPLVAEQDQLAAALREAEAAHETYTHLHKQVTDGEAGQKELAARFEAVSQSLDGLPVDEPPIDSVEPPGDLAAQLAVLREDVSKLEAAADRYADSQQALQVVQAELADLKEKFEQRTALQAELAALQLKMDDGVEVAQALRLRIAQAEDEQAKLAEYEQLLGGPDAVCPVCQRPMDEHAYADTVRHYEAERERLSGVLQAVGNDRAEAEAQMAVWTDERAALDRQIGDLPGQTTLDLAQARFDDAQALVTARLESVLEAFSAAHSASRILELLLDDVCSRVDALAGSSDRVDELQNKLAALGDPRRKYEQAEEQVAARPDRATDVDLQQQAVDALTAQLADLERQLVPFAGLDEQLADVRQQRDANQTAQQQYLANYDVAQQLAARQTELAEQQGRHAEQQEALTQLQQAHEAAAAGFDEAAFEAQQNRQQTLLVEQTRTKTNIENTEKNLAEQQDRLARLEAAQLDYEACEREAERLGSRLEVFRFVRTNIRNAGPQIAEQLVKLVGEHANQIFGDILDDHSLVLKWNPDYSVSVLAQTEERDFGLLSGGEQMAAAIAIRLALLTQLGNVQFAFFDEPTTNLDDTRRSQLAERLAAIQSLKQLFVISHDDTFEQESYHVVQVAKVGGLSQVEMR